MYINVYNKIYYLNIYKYIIILEYFFIFKASIFVIEDQILIHI